MIHDAAFIEFLFKNSKQAPHKIAVFGINETAVLQACVVYDT